MSRPSLAGLVTEVFAPAPLVAALLRVVTTGAVTILMLVFGGVLAVVAPLAALIGWSRVELGAHTPAQVLAGAALGVGIGAVVLPLLSAG